MNDDGCSSECQVEEGWSCDSSGCYKTEIFNEGVVTVTFSDTDRTGIVIKFSEDMEQIDLTWAFSLYVSGPESYYETSYSCVWTTSV